MWRDWRVDIDAVGISCHNFFEQIVQPGYFSPFLEYFFSMIESHWTGIEPYPDTETLYEFQPVTFITARRQDLIPATRDWLHHYFPRLYYNLLQSRSKDKINLLTELQLDGIVEDRLQTANTVAERGLLCYLVNRTWNQGRWTHPNVIRINSLKAISRRFV